MTNLRTIETPAKEAHDATVRALKELLEMAEKGEIIGVAIAAIQPDMTPVTMCSALTKLAPLLGSIQILTHRILEQNRNY
jgi:hypothetical protein